MFWTCFMGLGKLSRYSDLLWAGRSTVRILVGARFSTPILTSPGAHPASYTIGTGYFLGVKWLRCGTEHPPPSSASTPLWAFVACSTENFTFTFTWTYVLLTTDNREEGSSYKQVVLCVDKYSIT